MDFVEFFTAEVRLVQGRMEAGYKVVVWNGRTISGRERYLYREDDHPEVPQVHEDGVTEVVIGATFLQLKRAPSHIPEGADALSFC
jgi:hypothetical protein